MKRFKLALLGWVAMAVSLATAASPTVYIPLGAANEIMIVDAATDKEIASISGVINPHGLSISPNAQYLVAGSNTEEKVGCPKMGPHENTPIKPGQSKMPTSTGTPEAAHKKHHSSKVGGLFPTVGISHVSLIRVADNKLERRIKVRGMAHHTLVMPNGQYAVSTHTTAGTISLIDLNTKTLFRTIQTGPLPNYIAVTRDGRQIYVSNAGNNTISVIDTTHWIVSRNIIVGKGPEHIVISPDEKFLYTSNAFDGTISVISLAQHKVLRTYTVGNNPHGIDISSDGKILFASVKKDNKLVAIDLKTGKLRALKLDPAPYHVKIISDTGKIYVSSRKKPFIWVIDSQQLKITGKIPLRGTGHQMVVMD